MHLTFILMVISVGVLPAFCGDWWPQKHFVTLVRTEPFPSNTIPTMMVWRQPSLNWDLFVRWENEDPAGMRPYLGHLNIEDDRSNVLSVKNFELPIFAVFECQADTDAAYELCVTYKDKTKLGARLYDWPNFDRIGEDVVLLESDFEWRGNDFWDTWMMPMYLVTGAGDRGEPGLLYRVFSGWSHMPRGLLMVEAATGKELWRHWMAAPPDGVALDKSNPESPVILWAAGAPATGARCATTADSIAYILGFDIHGNELWRREYPVTFTAVTVASVKPPGQNYSAYELVSSYSPDKLPTTLYKLDAASGQIMKERRVYHPERRAYLTGLSSPDGQVKLLVNTYLSSLQVFNENLDSLWSTNAGANFQTEWDIDGDGVVEIPVTTPDGHFEVYNLNGNCLISEKVQGVVKAVQRIKGRELARIWMISDRDYSGYDLERNPYYELQLVLASSGYILGGIGLVWLLVWSIRTRRAYVQARREKLILEGWAQVASFQAHDTKKPIAVIQRALDNFEIRLQRQHPDLNAEQFLARMRGELNRMLQTARQIQVVSRATKPTLQEHDLISLIDSTVERMNLLEQSKVVHEKNGYSLIAHFDYRLIESLLENLIGNAMDASPQEAVVRVSAERPNHGVQGVKIQVKDAGKGMSEQEIADILAGKGSKKTSGQGLGILCAKWIAESHKGDLSIDSQPGVGTTITVTIPDNGGETSPAKT